MTVRINESNLKQGLLGLVIALVEIIKETLEGQALKRMESGRLTEEEVERLGNALIEIDRTLEKIKKENDLKDSVKTVRDGLDDLADQIISVERWEEELKGV